MKGLIPKRYKQASVSHGVLSRVHWPTNRSVLYVSIVSMCPVQCIYWNDLEMTLLACHPPALASCVCVLLVGELVVESNDGEVHSRTASYEHGRQSSSASSDTWVGGCLACLEVDGMDNHGYTCVHHPGIDIPLYMYVCMYIFFYHESLLSTRMDQIHPYETKNNRWIFTIGILLS